jgi:hypothetical protein
MSALTEIYVDNVTRHLPEDARPDIAAEITATIDDMVDARLGEDADPTPDRTAAIEREVLEELGDPAVLSREYSNSPQHLIGPNSYSLFVWALRWVLPIVGLLAVLTQRRDHHRPLPRRPARGDHRQHGRQHRHRTADRVRRHHDHHRPRRPRNATAVHPKRCRKRQGHVDGR